MSDAGAAASLPSGGLGDLLRHWRGQRRCSQLELSTESGVSQRHISFVESGRSVPSRQTLLCLARALDVPLRERNSLLLAAGFAPIYPEDELESPSMRTVTVALKRMLRQQEPFPALVMDRYWDVQMTNQAAPRFFSRFVDLSTRPRPRNLLQLMFDPQCLRPYLANWDEAAASLIERVHRETVSRTACARTKQLLATLMAYPGVQPGWAAPPAVTTAPVVPLVFEQAGLRLSFFSLVTTLGTPRTVTAQELRLECMFPADPQTEEAYAAFLDQPPAAAGSRT